MLFKTDRVVIHLSNVRMFLSNLKTQANKFWTDKPGSFIKTWKSHLYG